VIFTKETRFLCPNSRNPVSFSHPTDNSYSGFLSYWTRVGRSIPVVGAKHSGIQINIFSNNLSAGMLRPYNIFSNNLSAGMLRPYRYLWFTRGENCCNIYNFNPGFFAPTASPRNSETGFLFRFPQITRDTQKRNPVSLPQQPEIYSVQSSITRPGIREKSRLLRVTITAFTEIAIAAIRKSFWSLFLLSCLFSLSRRS